MFFQKDIKDLRNKFNSFLSSSCKSQRLNISLLPRIYKSLSGRLYKLHGNLIPKTIKAK